MAFRTTLDPSTAASTVGVISPPIGLDSFSKVSNYLGILHDAILAIVAKLNFTVTFGDGVHGHKLGNVDGEILSFITPAPADTEFIVRHDLRRVPVGWLVMFQDRPAQLYADNYQEWSNQTIRLKCNVALATLTIGLT